MATAEQVKSLVKAYVERNDDYFKTVVLQIAAHEAKVGHDKVARELKQQVDKITKNRTKIIQLSTTNPLFHMTFPSSKISELVTSDEIYDKIARILNEYRNKNKLYSFGLANRRKILLEGLPGTGKTMTASIIASELSLPLYVVQMDKLVSKFMGETSVKLRQVFDHVYSETGVYLFDEFDAIAADRNLDNEVGEMKRILNSLLQFIEQDNSQSIIIAATNNKRLLDQALFRRFDDILHYDLPNEKEIKLLLENRLFSYDSRIIINSAAVESAKGLSQAEIVRVCDDVIKTSILNNSEITSEQIILLLEERHKMYFYKEA
ncbi:AAA family ATPase [Phascolarctobacterium succinatutens]|uniref:AAA family ATPase n=1 Tax=Phascolarctobacterium succinatutens TaxID=626940 RepID=UPI00307EA51B